MSKNKNSIELTRNGFEDNKKGYYYRGLSNWNMEKGYLIDTCLDGQDTVRALLKVFGVEL